MRLFTVVLCCLLPVALVAQQIKVVAMKSNYVDARNIRILLPKNYNAKNKYAVLYMQDGQMLFDSTTTWNRQEWQLDETLNRLTEQRKLQNVIVVGIDNNGAKREAEYFPQAVVPGIPEPEQAELQKLMPGGPTANNYLKFIIEELQPYIDKHYSVYGDAQHTFIGGSSLGGMISVYAICQYPKVFGGAMCLSTHWTGTFVQNTAIPQEVLNYLDKQVPSPATHRIYFDRGTATLDALYSQAQQRVDSLFKAKGYSNKNLKTLVFQGASHSERDWAKRLDVPLVFLLGRY